MAHLFFKRVFVLAAMMLALLPLATFAQTATPPPTSNTVSTSGFQIQNLSTTEQANVTINYFALDGTKTTQGVTIPANGSQTLIGFGNTGDPNTYAVPTGFVGSVRIDSDQPVAAIANLSGNSFALGSSYTGFEQGSQTVNLPLILRNNPGAGKNPVSTSINVQNASDATVTVNVKYTHGSAGNDFSEAAFDLAPGVQKTFSQGDSAHAAMGDTGTINPGVFVGSGQVTANGPVAVTVQQEGANQLLSYGGFGTGSRTVAAPLIVAGNTTAGNFTGLQIQNTGTASTNITVAYAQNTATVAAYGRSPCGTSGTMQSRTFALAAGASRTLLHFGVAATGDLDANGFDSQFFNCLYVGGATVTSDATDIVAIVNQVNLQNLQASAYEGFVPTTGSADTRVPLAMSGNFGILTGIQVQNVGSAAAAVTVSYSANTATAPVNGVSPCKANPQSQTKTIDPNNSFTFLQFGVAGVTDPAFNTDFINCVYVGSATVTTADTTGKVVAIVNQTNITNPRPDALLTYDAFNQ